MSGNDDGTAIVKARDYADIVKLSDPTVMEQFLEEPLSFIAELTSGFIASGPKELALATGRVLQAALKGRLLEQWGAEFKKLREKGTIPKDFAESKYGFQTWAELLTIIDSEAPDADRLEALKAMFLAVNRVDATDGQRILAYQLWLIAKRLNSGELLLLKAAYENRSKFSRNETGGYDAWAYKIAGYSGHEMPALVNLHEKALVENGLMTARVAFVAGPINTENCRLTSLGIKFCENIEKYIIEVREDGPA